MGTRRPPSCGKFEYVFRIQLGTGQDLLLLSSLMGQVSDLTVIHLQAEVALTEPGLSQQLGEYVLPFRAPVMGDLVPEVPYSNAMHLRCGAAHLSTVLQVH